MFDYYLSEVCSFPMTDKKGVDLEGKGDREGLGAAEGGEMVIKIYCLREESISYKYRQTNKQTNKNYQEPGMVVHDCNPSTWDAEAGGLPRVLGYPGLYNKFQADLSSS